ncbi:adenosylcobinamide-phosphate synthase CbiB [Salinirubellus salinus]|uniref:Probable cobalamin biosynthesis protein CobD n=1 Tax=Salinirubellus salinus TaxID=1364945 RepID=A0A9E7U985_9EURY|nr:adenosylcobinamide-phosphate synthase CbiB [Salinirubellus salinus]UWM52802.1 adenosylcobinamide-phosphate synthase CbiB [Salinirubellus salinus]
MGLTAVAAVGLAFALDATVEEFPGRIHPVALFGRLVAPFDRSWSRPRTAGLVAALCLPLGFAGVAYALVALASGSVVLTAIVAGLALFATTSRRMLVSAAREVVAASETDLDAARDSLLALAGRDASALSAGELRSAAVESAAENLADGLVAPILAFALGAQLSLALGVAAAAWVKGVNTLDSMLGYRSKPVGWASARLDDAVMWLPARLSAVLVALARPAPRALTTARRWARTPPSPNSGWPMATLAVAIDVELTKPGVYTLNPDADLPTPERARLGVRTVAVAGLLAFALAAVAVGVRP